jgi:hypothetical protein
MELLGPIEKYLHGLGLLMSKWKSAILTGVATHIQDNLCFDFDAAEILPEHNT